MNAAASRPSGLPLPCRGAPRDLGRDQGEARRESVRRTLDPLPLGGALRLLRLALAPDSRAARVHRDLGRYFPHLAERSVGLARGAGVPATLVSGRLADELEAREAGAERCAVRLSGRGGAGVLLGRSLAARSLGELVVRQSEPDHDFRSLEVVGCAAPGAWIGVNEHGLAVAATALPAGPASLEACAAPATLLVQECLQRFDALEPALTWCERRPAGGVASLLLADVHGRAVGLRIEGTRRVRLEPAQGLLVAPAPAGGHTRLAERLREAARPDAVELAAALAAAPGAAASVLVDPVGRRLCVVRPGEPPQAFDLHADARREAGAAA